MRVLIVEDENSLAEQIGVALRERKFVVDLAHDGEEGLHRALQYPLNLAVIDLGLPKLSGLELIQKLRQEGKSFPILILTARSQWQDKVHGLEAGADDYLVKPFHMEELLARVSALLRRSAGWTKNVISAGPISLELSSQIVTKDDVEVELTAFEYKVLKYLMMHPGEIVSKTTLTEHIYEQDFDKDSNVIEVFIARLRKKLDPDNTLNPIDTLRGRGYKFTISPTEE